MHEDHFNHVELIGTYGGDLTHALSAWTSTSRNLTPEKRARVTQLLKQLADAGHHSVYEKSSIHFLVTCDVVTHYQLLKHRVGVSINAESARYKELKDDKYFVPDDWDDDEKQMYIEHMEAALIRYHDTLERLVKKGVPRKRAKESARFYLPCGNQLTLDVMFNFRSFAHFVGLRHAKGAQREISRLTGEMIRLVRDTGEFDASLQAFGHIDSSGVIKEETE